MTTVLDGPVGIAALVGQHLGYSPFVDITQERVNLFAEATGDRQWIHVDPERAKDGPFGGTIAHGLLTLSMIGDLATSVFKFQGFRMGLNYGYDKIRFPAPVPVGAKLRLGARLLSTDAVAGAIQSVMELTVEIEGGPKPACVAQMIFRHIP